VVVSVAIAGVIALGACDETTTATTAGDTTVTSHAGAPPDSTATSAAVTAARPYTFTMQHVDFVDTTRPTEGGTPDENAPTRTLATDIYVPDGAGPFPLIVFSHGLDGHPRKFTQLLGSWAAAGYVVAAPAFPLTNDDVVTQAVGDYTQQPADVSFVMTQTLKTVSKADPHHIGVAGLSLGGVTTYAVAFNSCCRDNRIKAAIAMAPNRFPFDGTYDFSGLPKMFIQGDADPALPYSDTVEAYAEAKAPKYFVTLEHGNHAPPFEDTPDDHDDVVKAVTLDFWDATLLGDTAAATRIAIDAAVPGLSHLDAEP
jgi:predicted dienelactone hydrolase